MIDAVERGQRAVIGKQVDVQRGAARLERVADKAGRIHAVVPDYEHSHPLRLRVPWPTDSFGAQSIYDAPRR